MTYRKFLWFHTVGDTAEESRLSVEVTLAHPSTQLGVPKLMGTRDGRAGVSN